MTKEKAPAFQFYASDYLSDIRTQSMTIEEEGCYLRLILFCWREEKLPSDESALSCLCKGVKPTLRVLSCFIDDGNGYLRHPRLDKERKKQKEWITKSRDAGYKSAAKRWGYKRKPVLTNLTPLVEPNGNQHGNQMVTLQSSSSSSSSILKENIYKRKPSKRVPNDFTLTEEMREWAKKNVPNADLNSATESFKDHEFKNAHSDWIATWRNWMRNPLNGNGNRDHVARPVKASEIPGAIVDEKDYNQRS